MKVLIDTNVVLDLLLRREPWGMDAARLFAAIAEARLEGWIAAHTVTTIHYVIAKRHGNLRARDVIGSLIELIRIAPVSDVQLRAALRMRLIDFEDCVQVAAARGVGAQCIVTRDMDFGGAEIAARTPGEVLAML